VKVSHNEAPELDAFIENYKKIMDNETHTQLQADLVEHLKNHLDLFKNIRIECFYLLPCNI
jgi:hypothetical protein